MTEEKKTRETAEDEQISETQLEDVAGGVSASGVQEMSVTKKVNKASAPLMNSVTQGEDVDTVNIDFVSTAEGEDD